jgi:beta-galactosidase
LSIITISIRDAQGRIVPTASDRVHFTIQGPGKIIGVGNGDPSCHEPDKYPSQSGWQRSAFPVRHLAELLLFHPTQSRWQRSAFCGLAQVIVQSSKDAGNIQLTATADGLRPATVAIDSQACQPRACVP